MMKVWCVVLLVGLFPHQREEAKTSYGQDKRACIAAARELNYGVPSREIVWHCRQEAP